MRNYLKKCQTHRFAEVNKALASVLVGLCAMTNRKKFLSAAIVLGIGFLTLAGAGCVKAIKNIAVGEEDMMQLSTAPIAATSGKKGIITIPTGTVKANPFVPYRDLGGTSVTDVPAYNLVEPPEMLEEGSDAARVMDTMVSGILYDKFSPSAILNIEGNDYLVKKGDVVNNYKVLNIAQDSVTVKLGANTYKAGIGEILTEGTLNHNNVSNLSNKFGGEK